MKQLWLTIRFFIYGFLSFACLGLLIQTPLVGTDKFMWPMIYTLGLWGGGSVATSCIATQALILIIDELIQGKPL